MTQNSTYPMRSRPPARCQSTQRLQLLQTTIRTLSRILTTCTPYSDIIGVLWCISMWYVRMDMLGYLRNSS